MKVAKSVEDWVLQSKHREIIHIKFVKLSVNRTRSSMGYCLTHKSFKIYVKAQTHSFHLYFSIRIIHSNSIYLFKLHKSLIKLRIYCLLVNRRQ